MVSRTCSVRRSKMREVTKKRNVERAAYAIDPRVQHAGKAGKHQSRVLGETFTMERSPIMTTEEQRALITLLESFDVPELRLDISRHSNVRWLLRNLRTNNKEKRGITEALEGLKTLARAQNTTSSASN